MDLQAEQHVGEIVSTRSSSNRPLLYAVFSRRELLPLVILRQSLPTTRRLRWH